MAGPFTPLQFEVFSVGVPFCEIIETSCTILGTVTVSPPRKIAVSWHGANRAISVLQTVRGQTTAWLPVVQFHVYLMESLMDLGVGLHTRVQSWRLCL